MRDAPRSRSRRVPGDARGDAVGRGLPVSKQTFRRLVTFRPGCPVILEPLLIVVLHPGGAPGYRAEVGVSQSPTFFTGGFQTDSRGRMDVLAPPDGDVKLSA